MSKFPAELEAALASVAKQYGKTALLPLGSGERLQVEVIPSSSLAIDSILGIGGFPRGRIVEIYGPESGGKTTLTLHIIAQAQRSGGIAAFLDAEHALDPAYAHALGVDTDNLLVSQPDNGEQALEIAEALIKSNSVDVVVVDSVAALVPKAELEGDMGQPQMGLQARLMSQALRKLTGITHKSKACLIFINQVRDKIGVMFGSPETTTGGRALKFYASVRLDIRKIQTAADKESNTVRVRCVKNKCAAPFKECECQLRFGEGIDGISDLINLGVEHGFVEKSGSWYSYGGERIGQGIDSARLLLREHPEIAEKLESRLRTKLFGADAR